MTNNRNSQDIDEEIVQLKKLLHEQDAKIEMYTKAISKLEKEITENKKKLDRYTNKSNSQLALINKYKNNPNVISIVDKINSNIRLRLDKSGCVPEVTIRKLNSGLEYFDCGIIVDSEFVMFLCIHNASGYFGTIKKSVRVSFNSCNIKPVEDEEKQEAVAIAIAELLKERLTKIHKVENIILCNKLVTRYETHYDISEDIAGSNAYYVIAGDFGGKIDRRFEMHWDRELSDAIEIRYKKTHPNFNEYGIDTYDMHASIKDSLKYTRPELPYKKAVIFQWKKQKSTYDSL